MSSPSEALVLGSDLTPALAAHLVTGRYSNQVAENPYLTHDALLAAVTAAGPTATRKLLARPHSDRTLTALLQHPKVATSQTLTGEAIRVTTPSPTTYDTLVNTCRTRHLANQLWRTSHTNDPARPRHRHKLLPLIDPLTALCWIHQNAPTPIPTGTVLDIVHNATAKTTATGTTNWRTAQVAAAVLTRHDLWNQIDWAATTPAIACAATITTTVTDEAGRTILDQARTSPTNALLVHATYNLSHHPTLSDAARTLRKSWTTSHTPNRPRWSRGATGRTHRTWAPDSPNIERFTSTRAHTQRAPRLATILSLIGTPSKGNGPALDLHRPARNAWPTFPNQTTRDFGKLLGTNPDRWDLALSLIDDFTGTLGELLDTIDALTTT